jgi:hypothetical protein
LTHISEFHELTQDLMGAKRQYQEAACQAFMLGVIELTPSHTSRFCDQEEDSDEQTEEAAMSITRIDIGRIEKWKEAG